jgi:4Fe-4S ferredoxin
LKYLTTYKKTKLVIERRLWVNRYTLILDKERCKNCSLCRTVCPKEAIEVSKFKKMGNLKPIVSISINPEKCIFCGICVCICPFSALKLLINGKNSIPVVESGSFPTLIKQVQADTAKCDPHCTKCRDACPLKININMLKRGALELCPCCGWCQEACPDNIIRVQKIFYGTAKINSEKCPEGCKYCMDACPVNAILLDNSGKAHLNSKVCIYCGACQNICPMEGAIEINRTGVHVTPVKSGAWNKALEKLTSTKTFVKELRTKSSTKIYRQVQARFYGKKEGKSSK